MPCSAMLTAWWPRGLVPNSCTSAMWEIHVTGCQLASTVAVIAQTTLLQDMGIVRDVGWIVIVHKVAVESREIKKQRTQKED